VRANPRIRHENIITNPRFFSSRIDQIEARDRRIADLMRKYGVIIREKL